MLNARIEGILFPNFVRSTLNGREALVVRVRAMSTSVLELYRESVESIYAQKIKWTFCFYFYQLTDSLHD